MARDDDLVTFEIPGTNTPGAILFDEDVEHAIPKPPTDAVRHLADDICELFETTELSEFVRPETREKLVALLAQKS